MGRKVLYVGDSDVVNKSQKGILDKARKKLNKTVLTTFRDGIGRIGYEYEKFFLGAKAYPYGYLLSTHKSMVDLADSKDKDILMYVASSNKFYMFKTKDIKSKGVIVKRGHEQMYNYDIKMGVRWVVK